MLHMAAAAASMVCQLGSRSRGSLPEDMAARGGRISTPASQALRERLSGRELAGEGGSVRGKSEARVTVWWEQLMQRPTLPAPEGPGPTACSRIAAEDTPSRHDGRPFLPIPSPPTPPPVTACGS